jgi:glycine amidinotransferase/scyllo-inosamine-4-phosphate amidinotransferase 1
VFGECVPDFSSLSVGAPASKRMSLVDVHNEWDPLEEVIIGTAVGARIPVAGVDLVAIEFAEFAECAERLPSGPLPKWVIEQTEAELAALCDALCKLDVTVRRPELRDHAAFITTPDWQTDGFYDYCPRDVLLTLGNTVIETPMVLRSRFLEPFVYKQLLLEYFCSGARWISAPKPRLAEEMFNPDAPPGQRLGDAEPAFDAANVLRFGTDILYLVSDTGNELGWRWLQSVLGSTYTVHPCRKLYAATHVDSTIVPLRPGLVLLNPARVNEDNMPEFLRDWDKLYAPDLMDTGWIGERPHCSKWIGMNLLVIKPGLVIADDRQLDLIRILERAGLDVLPLRLTHSRTLGGSFHCVSLDVRRRGKLETYR